MFVISVIPLSRATALQSLSYYSSDEYPLGTIISVPVRKKLLPAIVIENEPVSAAKTALRAATFSLRKLEHQADTTTIPRSLLDTAKLLTKETPAQLGSILFALLPPDIRTGARPYPFTKEYENTEMMPPYVFTNTREHRYLGYRSIIRQAFAHRGSVLLVVPTSIAVEQARAILEHGIEKRIITFASTHTKRQIDVSYESFVDFSSAKLIITTPNFAFLDRHDLTTIIIDNAGSPHYKTRTRPYLDARDALRAYATATKRTLILGDTLPRTEEEAWRRDDLYQTYDEHPHRLNFDNTCIAVSHLAADPAALKKPESYIFTPELVETINRTIENKGRTFLLAARRGLAPLVTCNDCGYIFRCPDSGAPYTLLSETVNGEEARYFFSAVSGRKERAADTCPYCGSWRLKELGIGIQQVVRETRKYFPDQQVFTFDHTTATTYRRARQVIEQFNTSKSGILVGTPMVLPYMTAKAATSGIISYDAMRSVPSWRIEESTLRTLFEVRELTDRELVVQTRSEPDQLLKYLSRGLIDEFYEEEIGMRQILSYPPFANFVLLSWQGDADTHKATEELIVSTLAAYDVQCYNSPLQSAKPVRHGLVRVSHRDWPDPSLMDKLRSLPPYIRIEISPDRIV